MQRYEGTAAATPRHLDTRRQQRRPQLSDRLEEVLAYLLLKVLEALLVEDLHKL